MTQDRTHVGKVGNWEGDSYPVIPRFLKRVFFKRGGRDFIFVSKTQYYLKDLNIRRIFFR